MVTKASVANPSSLPPPSVKPQATLPPRSAATPSPPPSPPLLARTTQLSIPATDSVASETHPPANSASPVSPGPALSDLEVQQEAAKHTDSSAPPRAPPSPASSSGSEQEHHLPSENNPSTQPPYPSANLTPSPSDSEHDSSKSTTQPSQHLSDPEAPHTGSHHRSNDLIGRIRHSSRDTSESDSAGERHHAHHHHSDPFARARRGHGLKKPYNEKEVQECLNRHLFEDFMRAYGVKMGIRPEKSSNWRITGFSLPSKSTEHKVIGLVVDGPGALDAADLDSRLPKPREYTLPIAANCQDGSNSTFEFKSKAGGNGDEEIYWIAEDHSGKGDIWILNSELDSMSTHCHRYMLLSFGPCGRLKSSTTNALDAILEVLAWKLAEEFGGLREGSWSTEWDHTWILTKASTRVVLLGPGFRFDGDRGPRTALEVRETTKVEFDLPCPRKKHRKFLLFFFVMRDDELVVICRKRLLRRDPYCRQTARSVETDQKTHSLARPFPYIPGFYLGSQGSQRQMRWPPKGVFG
ncbi:hypothetical protein T439DRAFT_368320 [Meredithblackwellia eburnea MCA 4105]